MGRMAGYTGQEITWEQALESEWKIVPEITAGWDSPVPPQEIALPGVTQFV